jgi:hypothetical protein
MRPAVAHEVRAAVGESLTMLRPLLARDDCARNSAGMAQSSAARRAAVAGRVCRKDWRKGAALIRAKY